MERIVNELQAYIPLLAPLVLIQLILIVVCLRDLSKRTATRGPKWLWVVVIIFINFLGPIIYLVVGREDE
jgi:hypothetical protein